MSHVAENVKGAAVKVHSRSLLCKQTMRCLNIPRANNNGYMWFMLCSCKMKYCAGGLLRGLVCYYEEMHYEFESKYIHAMLYAIAAQSQETQASWLLFWKLKLRISRIRSADVLSDSDGQ